MTTRPLTLYIELPLFADADPVRVKVVATRYPGCRGTLETPPEAPEHEIQSAEVLDLHPSLPEPDLDGYLDDHYGEVQDLLEAAFQETRAPEVWV